jgi:hypothetical protein
VNITLTIQTEENVDTASLREAVDQLLIDKGHQFYDMALQVE